MAINTVSNIMIGRFPIIEYGNIVWGPMYIDQKKKIERIQRRVTRLVSAIRSMPVTISREASEAETTESGLQEKKR